MRLRNSKSGFTIVEVLVVIGIIGVLTAIVFPSISNIRAKNRDTERVADIAALQLGLSLYYNQHTTEGYPLTLDALLQAGNYVTGDSIVGPKGESYLYVPLKGSSAEKCIFYHLGAELELPSSQIDTGNAFSSVIASPPSNYAYCTGYTDAGFNGADALMYDVHP